MELLFLPMHFAVKREKKGRVRPCGTRFTLLLWRHRTQHSWALLEKGPKRDQRLEKLCKAASPPNKKRGRERHLLGEDEIMESTQQKCSPRKEGQVSEKEVSPRKGSTRSWTQSELRRCR